MVVENPATHPHYLTTYFPIKPTMIDKDRRENGDIFKKPTQYWFVNFEPKQNIIFEPLEFVEPQLISYAHKIKNGLSTQTNRSMIHPQYASRFIRQFIIDEQ